MDKFRLKFNDSTQTIEALRTEKISDFIQRIKNKLNINNEADVEIFSKAANGG